MHSLGSRIRKRRLIKGMSQYRLSKLTGLSPGHISEIENNNRPNLQLGTIKKIAKALDMPFEEFFEVSKELSLKDG